MVDHHCGVRFLGLSRVCPTKRFGRRRKARKCITSSWEPIFHRQRAVLSMLPYLNEAGARGPGIPASASASRTGCTASMRPGREAPEYRIPHVPSLGRSPRFNEAGARGPGIPTTEVSCFAADRCFNEAGARGPGILEQPSTAEISAKASMRPGREAPEYRMAGGTMWPARIGFNEAGARGPGIHQP